MQPSFSPAASFHTTMIANQVAAAAMPYVGRWNDTTTQVIRDQTRSYLQSNGSFSRFQEELRAALCGHPQNIPPNFVNEALRIAQDTYCRGGQTYDPRYVQVPMGPDVFPSAPYGGGFSHHGHHSPRFDSPPRRNAWEDPFGFFERRDSSRSPRRRHSDSD